MGRDGLGNVGELVRLLTGFFNSVSRNGLAGRLAGEQPRLRSFGTPPVTQGFQQPW